MCRSIMAFDGRAVGTYFTCEGTDHAASLRPVALNLRHGLALLTSCSLAADPAVVPDLLQQ